MADISVIVPIYGVEKYIEQCLRSLFTQTKTEGVEFILVNDCTKDSSMHIAQRVIAEFPNLNITVINHEVNRGLAASRQTGLDRATGEYILQIDSDDYVEPTMFADMYAKAKEDDADIICCNFYDDRRSKKIENIIGANNEEEFWNTYLQKNAPNVWLRLFRHSLYTDNNIKADNGVDNGEDLIVTVELTYFAKKISHLSESYVFYRYNKSSLSKADPNKFKELQKAFDILDIFLKQIDFFEKNADKIKLFKFRFLYSSIIENTYEYQLQAAEMFSDIKNDIFTIKELPFTAKIIIYLVQRKQIRLMRAFIAIRTFAKRLIETN